MDIAVLGATGTIGRLIVQELERAGHTVRRLSRAAGVDARSGEGLDVALTGAQIVVDAMNIATMNGDAAVSYFTRTAQNVARAAERAGVRRIVCVSIHGVTDPAVSRGHGYYRGKGAQERAYLAARVPVTVIRSAQWFELAEAIVPRGGIGPVAVVPNMRMAPLAASSAARLIGEEIGREDGADAHGDEVLSLRGPEEMTMVQLARRTVARRGGIGGRRPRLYLQLPLFGRAIARGGLIPREGAVDPLTLEEWLERS
ncbi:SDR family oxidoreductase [Brachybacterium hainanense]|uniref:SDR family oxidoreductase n=1 Tax=Brachybacterium hainanense TaxID=1541174 RepID=A0ABV6R9N1_9MICO